MKLDLLELVRNVILSKYPQYDTRIEDKRIAIIEKGQVVCYIKLDRSIVKKWCDDMEWKYEEK